jgi:putative DNA primase/helicase
MSAAPKLRVVPEDHHEPAHETPKVDASSLDSMEAARRFVSESAIHREGGDEVCKLRYWRGEFWEWNPESGHYSRMSSDLVRANLTRHLDAYARGITNAIKANVIDNVRALTIVPDGRNMPAWVDGEETFRADEILANRSGLLHLPTFSSGGAGYMIPHSPRFFSANALDYPFDANAALPTEFLKFLRELWGDDQQSIDTLQEWFGLYLTGDTRFQKILAVIGPKRSGKGTIARVLRGLVGSDNVAGPTLAGLATNFGLWPLVGKTVAIISDARLSGRTDSAVVTERLLSISGEDAITTDRKCLEPITVKMSVRFMILTNELPRLGDSSGALVGRMLVLRLTKSFYGREDQTLTDRLLCERPGILLWAIEGLRRLRARGYFVQPESGRELIGEMEDMASPVSAFIADCCVIDRGAEVTRHDLYSAWRIWCAGHGKTETDEATFGRDLRAAFPGLGNRNRRGLGVRVRAYVGIGLMHESGAGGA